MSKRLVIDVAEFSKFLKDNPELAKTVLNKDDDMVAGSPFEQFLIENPNKAEEIPGVSFEDVTEEDEKALQRIYGTLSLPTEDEIYNDALFSRAKNKAQQLERETSAIFDQIRALKRDAETALRIKMELIVLINELGEDTIKRYSLDNENLFQAGFKHIPLTEFVDYVETHNLQYAGPDLLKAYAQLKAVFDIDNERPVKKNNDYQILDDAPEVKTNNRSASALREFYKDKN